MAQLNNEQQQQQQQRKCAHGSCDCLAAPDSKYCSAYCEGAKNTVEIGCNCGHPGCR